VVSDAKPDCAFSPFFPSHSYFCNFSIFFSYEIADGCYDWFFRVHQILILVLSQPIARDKKRLCPSGHSLLVLYDSCFLQCCVCSVLVDCLDSSSRDSETDRFLKFRNVNFLVLEIYIASSFTNRVELSRTSCV
jgi:hypothetical protein